MDSGYFWHYSFPMKKGMFDDDYFFYEDGRILHFFDISVEKFNVEKFVSPSEIDESKKETMLKECPEEKRKLLKQILDC